MFDDGVSQAEQCRAGAVTVEDPPEEVERKKGLKVRVGLSFFSGCAFCMFYRDDCEVWAVCMATSPAQARGYMG